MKILAIETSCDETAISIIDASGDPLENNSVSIDVLSNIVLSQAKLHAKYGGVFPSLAKREHSKNLIPVLREALTESNFRISNLEFGISKEKQNTIKKILEREPELEKKFIEFISTIEKPDIDSLAVTYGPGLEPALWIGVNFAKALSVAWNMPLIPVNHMEGHLFSALLKKDDLINNLQLTTYNLQNFEFPVLALLISGGHTELILMKNWFKYEIVGETKDDAVGEAFDKVARMLGLPYPGGPSIARLAKKWESHFSRSILKPLNSKHRFNFPRPMIHSGDFNFSFSGLKTAVLYTIKKIPILTENIKNELSYEFQEAATEVLVTKTIRAADKYKVTAVLMGGGVSANIRINEALKIAVRGSFNKMNLFVAPKNLTGDNAMMIATTAYLKHTINKTSYDNHSLSARGNLRMT